MRKLIVSTCGTSLLTNLAGSPEERSIIVRHANAIEPDDVPAENRASLEGFIRLGRERLRTADPQSMEHLSAELNGLLRFYDGQLSQDRDHHWLIATDTWLGSATAELISEALQAAGHFVEVKRIRDLRTDDLGEFRGAMAELARLCAQDLRGMAGGGWRVVFNLTGGFKSVQGFMQALGMLYAHESVYVFERTAELLRLPKLPIHLDADTLVHRHERVFRRLAAGLPVSAGEASDLSDSLLMEIDGQLTLSVWGDVVWSEAGPALLSERLWPPVDVKLRYGPDLERSVARCSAAELRMLNERLGDLARHLHDSQYNPDRLDFKKLTTPHGRWTHECDAWASGAAKRLFGWFDGGVFVVDQLAQALH